MTTAVSVKKEIVVEAPQERAFRVFTENFDSWWPREYKIGKAAMKNAILERRANGRWYEVGDDGAECEWGKVLVWDPPSRLVLVWQIDAEWKYDASLVTEVEVHFVADGPKRTRVELEHRKLENYGASLDQMKGTLGGPGGWSAILEGFKKIAQG